jgi:dihydrofolate synthase/folylpolyglutamate synthase
MNSPSILPFLSPPLNYEEALAYWFGRINYEQSAPRPTDLKLDRMRTLLGFLGNPQDRLRIVHVAGSKGKGSTAAMLESILRQAGYLTGLFTSPHLCQVEERIQVNGRPITAHELATLMNRVRAAVEKLDDACDDSGVSGAGVTFFEIATALGFLYFAEREVDAAVIEVGLGGRFDSTNVCRPLVSVITSISFDHTQQLGNDLASIAREKAGIIKPGRPTISGVTAPEARQVIESCCRERHSDLHQLGKDFQYEYAPGRVGKGKSSGHRSNVRIVTPQRTWPVLSLGLLGEHQAANAAVALACVEQLRHEGLAIEDQAVVAGLSDVSWPARMEVLHHEPLVVLDCAHNVASAEALVKTLQTSFPPIRSEHQTEPGNNGNYVGDDRLDKRLLIFAGSRDKDLAGMLRVLTPLFAHIFLTQYQSPRAAPVEQLADLLPKESSAAFTVCPTPAEAWHMALKMAGRNDLICVTGSVFLAGELRPLLVGIQ